MQRPSWLTKPPCFDRIERGEDECFSSALVERGLSCVAVLPGGAASRYGYVIMSILRPMTPQICAGPTTPKAAPGLAAGNSSGSVFSLWEQGCITFFAESKVWPTAQEGQFKDIYIL